MLKSFLQFLSWCLLFCCASCAETHHGQSFHGPAKAEWPVKQLDLGEIPEGIPVTREFVVNNIGGKPLLIQDAKITCHCITADWYRQPIKPGKSGWVRVTYNAEKAGEFYRFIPVNTSADSVGQGTALIIKGKVTAPTNKN